MTGVAFLLLLAGHETTANMLALGTFALLEHPGQLAELRANPDLMPDAVEELMRYLSIADIFFRYAAADIELGGETIPAGSTVVVSLLAANRDPRRFENPDPWTSTARPAGTCPSATASTNCRSPGRKRPGRTGWRGRRPRPPDTLPGPALW